jgi:hypothetical protein
MIFILTVIKKTKDINFCNVQTVEEKIEAENISYLFALIEALKLDEWKQPYKIEVAVNSQTLIIRDRLTKN